MPASPGEFDPTCADARNTSCSLLAPWDRASDASTWSGQYYPAGYAAELWRPAGPFDWNALRFGMYASHVYVPSNTNNNATYAFNLLYAMESTLEAPNQVPFYGMSDRAWAIDGTVDVALPDLLQDAPFNLAPTDGDQGASYWIGKKVRLKGARMFAHAGASDMRAGPAGVVYSSMDYRGVMTGTCRKKIVVPTSNSETIGYYCVNSDCEYSQFGYYIGYHYLRTDCRSYTDFALECPVHAQLWLQKAFPAAYAAYAAAPQRDLTIQCPAQPWAANTILGDEPFEQKSRKPSYPTCGLSTRSYISFDGYGTDSTCCFEQLADLSKFCSAQPDEVPPSCNRYSLRPSNDSRSFKCQDMVNCAGGGRLEWPFFKGAWLDTGTADPCFQVPPIDDLVHRLPVIDVRSIPRVLSPFDVREKEYCDVNRYVLMRT